MGKMKFYDGILIVKRETIDDVVIETYIEVKDGVVFLKKYRNMVCSGETVIADLARENNNEEVKWGVRM